jgi:hypothetical protein
MRWRILPFMILPAFSLTVIISWGGTSESTAQSTAAAKVKVPGGAPTTGDHPANLTQLMRGMLFTESNVIFAAGGKNPDNVPQAKMPSAATDPLAGAYGKWEAVENNSLAIVEVANLLNVPGRLCSNGRPVPTKNADWPKLVQALRDAGMKSYQAAQSKNQDKILDASDLLTTACNNCHVKYFATPTVEDRCR